MGARAEEAAVAMPEEQARDVAALAALAGEETAALPGAEPAEPPPDPAEGLGALLTLVSGVFHMSGFVKVAAMWSPEVCREFAQKAVPVLRKYAWGQRIIAFLETGLGVEEIALVTFAAPLVAATYSAAREDIAAAKKRQPIDATAQRVADAPAPAPAPVPAGEPPEEVRGNDPFHAPA